jgi:hypothetical protein
MVNSLEQETKCTEVQRSEGKNRLFGNLWATYQQAETGHEGSMGYSMQQKRSTRMQQETSRHRDPVR